MKLAALALALALTGCVDNDADTPLSTPTVTTEPASLAERLAALPATPEHPAGYDRDLFGTPWRVDTDSNGCTAQQDVLARDLTSVVKRGRCTVLSGYLVDPYTDGVVLYQRGGQADVDIDHVVSLSDAWRSGAWQWTLDRRAYFASDPRNLLATDSSVNRSKGDQDGTWVSAGRVLPVAGRRCQYVGIVVTVKEEYGLSVDDQERAELAGAAGECG